MKKTVLPLLFLLFSGGFLFSQSNIPVLRPTLDKARDLDEEIKVWEKISDLIYDEEGNFQEPENQSEENARFLESVKEKYGEYLDEATPAWSFLPFGCSWYCGAVYETKVSSELSSTDKNDYSAKSIFDNDIRTAWVEGAKGYGIGEYIEFIFPDNSPKALSCMIANGYSKNKTVWKNNSRVKSLNMYMNDELKAVLQLEDVRELQTFDFSHLVVEDDHSAVTIKFVITEVYKGDKYDDTSISEFFFDGTGVHCLAEGTLVTMADGSLKNIESIKAGDNVLSYCESANKPKVLKVARIHNVVHQEMIKLLLSNNAEIITTADHPFLSSDGWCSFDPKKTLAYNRYSDVAKYKIGTELIVYDKKGKTNTSAILKIDKIKQPANTFTLELEEEGVFIANGILVGQE